MDLLLHGMALTVGCLLAVQASVNQQLNKAVGTPYGAAALQLAVALTALAVVAAATGAVGAVADVVDVSPAWLLLGGLASPLYITAGILLFPRLGALSAAGLFVTGQVFASLALDSFGWLSVPRHDLTLLVALGAVAVLVGMTAVMSSQRARSSERARVGVVVGAGAPAPPVREATTHATGAGWVGLGLVAGAVLPVQGAVNARLRDQIDASVAVAMISFTVATLAIAMALMLLVLGRRTPAPRFTGLRSMSWWGWLGGFCAATYVTATFLLIPEVGAAVTVALTVTGQQAASAGIDHFGWLGMTRRPMNRLRLSGLGLLIVGSALVQLA